MSKNEFLSILRGQLTGQIPTSEVESQISYYDAYISGQIGSGVREESAVEELGDPRLIAKTLIDSTNRAAEEAGYDGPYRTSTDTYDDSDGINSGIFGKSSGNSQSSGTYRENAGYSGQNDGAYKGTSQRSSEQESPLRGGAGCGGVLVILGIIVVLAILLVFSLIRFSIRNFSSIILIVAIVVGIGFLIRTFGRR